MGCILLRSMNVLVLIVVLIFAVIISLFSTQNTANVTVTVFSFPLIMPLYLVVFSSIISGLLISWVITLMESISTTITLLDKNRALSKTKKTVDELVSQIHALEIENAKLKGESKAKEEASQTSKELQETL